MNFGEFVWYAQRIEEESSDTEKINLLAEAFKRANENSIAPLAVFIKGDTFPQVETVKMGVGPAMVKDSIVACVEELEDRDDMDELVTEHGGVGESCLYLEFDSDTEMSAQSTLGEVSEVDMDTSLRSIQDSFYRIANFEGAGSKQEKQDEISSILNAFADEVVNEELVTQQEQAKFFCRILLGEMRIGVGEGTVRDAIAQAFDVDVDAVKHAIMVRTNYSEVAEIAAQEGEDGLRSLEFEIGHPIDPMLAVQDDISSVSDDWDEIVAEVKLDGSRLQCHKDGDDVTLYTRNYQDWTNSLPEIVESVRENVDAEQAIIDTEVIAVGEDGDVLPFEEVMKRGGRKENIDEMAEKIEVHIRPFDILYHEDTAMVSEELLDRLEQLEDVVPSEMTAERIIAESEEELQKFHSEVIERGHEGVMAKDPYAEYSPGKRGRIWRKLKPDWENIDCVVISGEYGKGRREGVIASYLLAVYDEDKDEFKPIGKFGSGMTDEQLESMTELFEEKIIEQKGPNVKFTKDTVVEVSYQDIQESPQYESGYALRFPSFKTIRSDKEPQDADTVKRVERWVED